jgi:hypothetical protein
VFSSIGESILNEALAFDACGVNIALKRKARKTNTSRCMNSPLQLAVYQGHGTFVHPHYSEHMDNPFRLAIYQAQSTFVLPHYPQHAANDIQPLYFRPYRAASCILEAEKHECWAESCENKTLIKLLETSEDINSRT